MRPRIKAIGFWFQLRLLLLASGTNPEHSTEWAMEMGAAA